MENESEKNYRQYFLTQERFDEHQKRIDKRIEKFSNSFLNNSKWRKLLLTIFSNTDLIQHCEINDFFSNCIVNLRIQKKNIKFEDFIYSTHIDPFITTADGPISYREIEFLAFDKSWHGEFVGRLVQRKVFTQDMKRIRELLSAIGKFEWEEHDHSIHCDSLRIGKKQMHNTDLAS